MSAHWRSIPARSGLSESDHQRPELGQVMNQLDLGKVPVRVAVLGLAEDGHPMLVRLGPRAQHIAVLGDTAAGRGVLLRSLVLSLALLTPQRQAQFAVIDATSALDCLEDLPHLLTPLIVDTAGGIELLDFLVALGTETGREWEPHVIVVIPELDQWGSRLAERVAGLGRLAVGNGIHLICSFAQASRAAEDVWEQPHNIKLVGRHVEQDDPQQNPGPGRYEAIMGAETWLFAPAFVSSTEARRLAEALWRQPGRMLVTGRERAGRRLQVVR